MHVNPTPWSGHWVGPCINGIGELVEVTLTVPEPAQQIRDCYACSLTLNGTGTGACYAHGVRRTEHVIK